MQEIAPSDIRFSDGLASSLDGQANVEYYKMIGKINFLSCFQERVLCPDAYLLTNTNLVNWLHETCCSYLANGILVPVLRKETLVNGETVKVRDLSHLHQIYREIGMYDGEITKDPESFLFEHIGQGIMGIHERISDATKKRRSIVLRNPSMRSQYESMCYGAGDLGITEKLGIELRWSDILRIVKEKNNGIIPGRQQIYDAAKNDSQDSAIRKASDWIYYANMHNCFEGKPTVDYPDHVRELITPTVGQEKELDILVKKILSHVDVSIFAKLDLDKIQEIRRDYSVEWWKLRNRKDVDLKELHIVLCNLYGNMLQVEEETAVGITKGDMIAKLVDWGVLGTGVIVTLSSPMNPVGYTLMSGRFIAAYLRQCVAKQRRKRFAIAKGEKALSNIQ